MPAPSTSQAPSAPTGMPHFSPTRLQGHWVFVSGQMAFGDQWRIEGDTVEEQTRNCLSRIAQLLAPHGLGLADVIKTTVWLAQVGDFAAFDRSYGEVFAASAGALPARSTVRADLMAPGALVEIEAIACRPPTGD